MRSPGEEETTSSQCPSSFCVSVPLEEYKEIGFFWATTSGPVSVFFWFQSGYMFTSLVLLFDDWVLPSEYTVWLFLDLVSDSHFSVAVSQEGCRIWTWERRLQVSLNSALAA